MHVESGQFVPLKAHTEILHCQFVLSPLGDFCLPACLADELSLAIACDGESERALAPPCSVHRAPTGYARLHLFSIMLSKQ